MALTVDMFRQIAAQCRAGSRDLVVRGAGNAQSLAKGYLGRLSCTAGRRAENDATMQAFKTALSNAYGTFGEKAFDAVLKARADSHKSLRAQDVEAVIRTLGKVRVREAESEIMRQVTTHPKLFGATNAERRELFRRTFESVVGNPLAALPGTRAALTLRVSRMLDLHLRHLPLNAPAAAPAPTGGLGPVAPDAPTGLSRLQGNTRLQQVLTGRETSVEDRMKRGELFPGMRINADAASPMLLDKLKGNGVEPGFIYRNDWSAADSAGLMADTASPATAAAVLAAAGRASANAAVAAALAAYRAAPPAAQAGALEQLAFTLGAGCRQSVAFAAEYLIRQAYAQGHAANAPESLQALLRVLPAQANALLPARGTPPTPAQTAALEAFKREHFAELRDAVMTGLPAGDPHARDAVFTHFSDRHIAKLDYNEGDRIAATRRCRTASGGHLRLPDRVAEQKGGLFRAFRLTTAEKASVGAVGEALANDLTRLAGVPAQELTLIRGNYSDGAPKIMLEAKFAAGYHDFDGYCLQDGRIVTPPTQPGAQPVVPESLGRYKAVFLLLADRDAVGSHGQNKGLIDGRFFAIDPGHSLEGNGEYLDIRDNFSFTDTKKVKLEKRFLNFSVFDDATRFEKFEGVLQLRALRQSGRAQQLFTDYRTAFNPANAANAAEHDLYDRVQTRITAMETEFNGQMTRILNVFADQLAFYDALPANWGQGNNLRAAAIETIENLEKLTSPTVWQSEHKKVNLKHLEVTPETRIPWKAALDANGQLVYTSAKPLPADRLETLVNAMPSSMRGRIHADGTVSVIVTQNDAPAFFADFNEAKVAREVHRDEFDRRYPNGAPPQLG